MSHIGTVLGGLSFGPTDMVFGTLLKLPDEFFCAGTDVTDPFICASHLQSYTKTLKALPTPPLFVPFTFQKI